MKRQIPLKIDTVRTVFHRDTSGIGDLSPHMKRAFGRQRTAGRQWTKQESSLGGVLH